MRLLVWNIQFFTKSRISDNSGGTIAEQGLNAERTLANRNYIISTINLADPDVFVVLEVRSSQGPVGELATGEGPNGLLYLLKLMRSGCSTEWCLIPPLRVNPHDIMGANTYTEAVGIFWRNDRVDFTGPWFWPKDDSATGPSIPPTQNPGADASTYPSPWDQAVPAHTYVAPCIDIFKKGGERVILADPLKLGKYARRPVFTTFQERGGMQRTIRLFSVHTKPSQARQALIELTAMHPLLWKPAANEVTVFAGDFNINLLKTDSVPDNTALNYFKKDIDDGTPRHLIPFLPAQASYPPSVFHTRNDAQPSAYLKNSVYDYGFVTYGTGSYPGVDPAAVVINRVAGVVPGGILPPFTSDMVISLTDLDSQYMWGTDVYPPSRVVNITGAQLGAKRKNEEATITTEDKHELAVGQKVTVANVAPGSFNGTFIVTSVPTLWEFTYYQKDYWDETGGGGGTVDALPRLNEFRSRPNFGHLGPPTSEGTSDHLPVFMIV